MNDLLRFSGPIGTFFLRGVAGKHLVFLATGTGIAPVKSILGKLVELPVSEQPASMSAYWGGRVLDDLYWEVDCSINSFKYTPVLSRPLQSWSGARGYVQDVYLREHQDLLTTVVYACGSDAMIRSVASILSYAGLPTGNFISDAFVCSGKLKSRG